MTEYKQLLLQPQYNFINDRPELGKHIILLGLSGSISYGTNNAESDLDLRGGYALRAHPGLYSVALPGRLICNLLGFDTQSFISTLVEHSHN